MSDARPAPPVGYPRWVAPFVAIPPVIFGILSITGAGRSWWVVGIAVAVALVPWLVDAVRPGRLRPVVFVLWVVVPIAVLNTAGGALDVDLSAEGHSQFTIMLLIWLVGEMAARDGWSPVVLSLLGTVGVVVGRVIAAPHFAHALPYWLGGAVAALLTGIMLRRQQRTVSELHAAQAALAGEAAQRERQRIAREVHDVVAHTLTVTLMHVAAARRALDRDPAGAREALAEAETLGRRSLADIRRTVGLLRTDQEPPETHALPDATDIPTLLESYRSAGTPLTVETSGQLAAVPPATGLTLYRLVQETLSNAAGHAPGTPVDLRIHIRRRDVEVVVSNPLPEGATPRAGGLGLVGMRERVEVAGGRIDVAAEHGRWTVRARLPLEEPRSAARARA